jgi:hypothetical protein
MTVRRPNEKTIFSLAIALLVSPRAYGQATGAFDDRPAIRLKLELIPRLNDYGLPYHPLLKGETQAGTIGRAKLVWTYDRHLEIEAGVLGRVPFALNIGPEAGALPILALTLHPFGRELLIRFGSLDIHHGYHPAIVDEKRYDYGRDYQAAYNRSLLPIAQRNLGGDPFMPAEHGGQIIAEIGSARVEGFLDWQLIETAQHREKFAVGLLGSAPHPFGELGLQFRLIHYGGESYTQSDPLRASGLDPTRQFPTLGITERIELFSERSWTLDVPLAFVRGHVVQAPGQAAAWQSGFEAGIDLGLFELARVGYRLWLPIERSYGFTSEDADPVYAETRSHRAIFSMRVPYGAATLAGRFDLIFPQDFHQVQYELVSMLAFSFETVLWKSRD